jgi:hypothetical protein
LDKKKEEKDVSCVTRLKNDFDVEPLGSELTISPGTSTRSVPAFGLMIEAKLMQWSPASLPIVLKSERERGLDRVGSFHDFAFLVFLHDASHHGSGTRGATAFMNATLQGDERPACHDDGTTFSFSMPASV